MKPKFVYTLSKWGVPTVTFDNKTDEHKRLLIEGAAELCRLFRDRFGLDLFVAYGVLLGFTRAGDFIGHDDDFDLAYISPQTDKDAVLRESVRVVEALLGLGYKVKLDSYGQYKLFKRVRRHKLKLEVFVGWTEAGRTRLYFGIDKGVDPAVFLPLGKRGFRGVDLPVPNDPERFCEVVYGEGWRTPDPGFSYALDREKWRPFQFLRSTANLGYWNEYYARRRPQEPWSLQPSPFAASTAERTRPGRLLEVGCGNGRDALFFAAAGYEVRGVDYCEAAVKLCAGRAAELGVKAAFEPLNLYDIAQVTEFMAANAGAFDDVYARFFVHAITEIGEEELLKLCAGVLRPGGRCHLEFRTKDDERANAGRPLGPHEREDGHYRRFIDVDELVARAAAHGLDAVHRVEGHGMAVFGDEDPHVARVILQRPGAGAD